MEHNSARFQKWFELILTMLDGHNHRVMELAEVLGTSRRNFYYVLDALGTMGFHIVHEDKYYYIDPQSPFLQRISQSVNLSEDEAAYLYGLIDSTHSDSASVCLLRRKLERFYNLQNYTNANKLKQITANTALLSEAMTNRRVVILHGYSSPHSHSISDRVVEPYLFIGNKADFRAYEIKSKQNKTFKVARINNVEIVDTPWFNEDRHRQVYTDIFMFSDEERYHIKLRLSLLAYHLMLEEFPQSTSFLSNEDENHWLLDTDVVNYIGISRFILGLFEDVEIIEDDGLRSFLKSKIEKMSM